MSVDWLNRLAQALDVAASDLLGSAGYDDVPVAAFIGQEGAQTPPHSTVVISPRPAPDAMAVIVEIGIWDYRSGDEVWLTRLEPESYSTAVNRDVLVPRPGDRFVFGRLIGREGSRLQLLVPGPGRRQVVINDAPWLGVASKLIRAL